MEGAYSNKMLRERQGCLKEPEEGQGSAIERKWIVSHYKGKDVFLHEFFF